MDTFVNIYVSGFILSCIIFAFRAYRNKPATPPDYLDVIWWLFGWWFLLPIFIFRWIKYKIKGEDI
jgi:hypothetical protein